jgi:hypothetical protein
MLWVIIEFITSPSLSNMLSSLQAVRLNVKTPAVSVLMSTCFTNTENFFITLLFFIVYTYLFYSLLFFYFFVECLNVVVLPFDYSVRAETDRVSALGRWVLTFYLVCTSKSKIDVESVLTGVVCPD